MKKTVFLCVVLMFLATIPVFSATGWYYQVGDTGPAGGKIIYDCDSDNDSGNGDGLISSECGWRYLEVAPKDIGSYPFGLYKVQSNNKYLFVNGTNTYNSKDCTGTEIGTGKRNTELLIAAMGDVAIADTDFYDPVKTSDYAAKLCADYECGGFDDWFLPSILELKLAEKYISSGTYWSSSEAEGSWMGADSAYSFKYGGVSEQTRDREARVRAVRAFLPEEQSSSSAEYSIGSYGPAKGYVFYDKGEYSDGWRYLEVSPEYFSAIFGAKADFYIYNDYSFGDVIRYDYVNMGTSTAVGSGKQNTELLVSAMGNAAIKSIDRFKFTSKISDEEFKAQIEGKVKTVSDYAANICHNYSRNGYEDWFLPSLDELALIRDNLYKEGLAKELFGKFQKNNLNFLSSSECVEVRSTYTDKPKSYYCNFDKFYNPGVFDKVAYDSKYSILLVRAF